MRLTNLFEDDSDDLFGTPTKDMQWKEHVAKVSRAILSQFEDGDIDSIRRLAMDSWNLVDKNGFKRISALEPILAQYPETAFKYAKYVIKGRWTEAEPYLVMDPDYGLAYAFHMMHGKRWPEFEEQVLEDQDSEAAFLYSRSIIKGRWPEAEPFIADSGVAVEYDQLFGTDLSGVNEDLSDDELFGNDEWFVKPVVRMLTSYNEETMDELNRNVYQDEDVGNELADEAEKADYIAQLLERGDIKRGINQLYDLDSQTRGTMTEFMKSYNVDLKKVYRQVLGLNEEDSSDEELFGTKERLYPSKLISGLNKTLDHFESNLVGIRQNEMHEPHVIEKLDAYYKKVRRSLSSNNMNVILQTMRSVLSDDDISEVYSELVHDLLTRIGDEHGKFFGVLTENEPSDDELFGQQGVTADPRKIARTVTNVANYVATEFSGDNYDNDVVRLHKAAKEFSSGRIGAGAIILKDIEEYEVWRLLEQELEAVNKVDIDELCARFGVNEEMSDEELFGEDQYDPKKIGLVALKLGKYYQRYEEDEDILEDAQHLIDISNVFFTQGLRAGIRALRVLTQDQVWSNLSHDLYNLLGLDLNALCDRYDPDNIDEDIDDDELFGAPTFEKINSYTEWVAKCGGNPDSLFPLSGLNPAFKSDKVAYLGYADISGNTPKIVGIFYTFRTKGHEEQSFGTKVNHKSFRIFQDYAKADPYNPLKGELR